MKTSACIITVVAAMVVAFWTTQGAGEDSETIDLAGLATLDEKTVWQAIANTGVEYRDWTACKEYEHNQTYLRIYLEAREECAAEDLEV